MYMYLCIYIERDIYLNTCTHTLVYYEEVIYAMSGLSQASLESVGQAITKRRSQAAWNPGATAEI